MRKALCKLYLEFDYNLGIEKILNTNIHNANMLMMAIWMMGMKWFFFSVCSLFSEIGIYFCNNHCKNHTTAESGFSEYLLCSYFIIFLFSASLQLLKYDYELQNYFEFHLNDKARILPLPNLPKKMIFYVILSIINLDEFYDS